jgi:HK97 gp10 family phage protein
MTFSIEFSAADIDATFSAMADDVEAAARPAAQAGAQVLYEEVKRNVARLKKHTGNLDRSIYQVFSKDNSPAGKATYHVSWNARKAPHGHLVEFGHLQRYAVTYDKATQRFTTHRNRPLPTPKHVAAKSFIRPAVAKLPAALEAAKAELFKRLDKGGKA